MSPHLLVSFPLSLPSVCTFHTASQSMCPRMQKAVKPRYLLTALCNVFLLYLCLLRLQKHTHTRSQEFAFEQFVARVEPCNCITSALRRAPLCFAHYRQLGPKLSKKHQLCLTSLLRETRGVEREKGCNKHNFCQLMRCTLYRHSVIGPRSDSETWLPSSACIDL